MTIFGGWLGYKTLQLIAPKERYQLADRIGQAQGGSAVTNDKLEQFFGADFFETIRDKVVLDFGCGVGSQCVEMARHGAKAVIGLDIQQDALERARQNAEAAGVSDRCIFAENTNQLADVITSKDAFEHFGDPEAVLQKMATLLKPGGYVLAAFGPTWLHPYGGHLFSVFPWSHLLFSEQAQIRWRAQFKSDGATRFSEVAGGLNQMTIARFERLVARSPFVMNWLDVVPIRGIPFLRYRPFREFGSSIVRCKLTPRGDRGGD